MVLFTYKTRRKNILMKQSANFTNYQQRVLTATEPVPYDDITVAMYAQVGAIEREPFFGLKVVLRDPYGLPVNMQRLDEIDHIVRQIFYGTGFVIRQTDSMIMPDGYWLTSLPRPLSQNKDTVKSLLNIMNALNQYLGFIQAEDNLIELVVSGKSDVGWEASQLQSLSIPSRYASMVVQRDPQKPTLVTLGRINNRFAKTTSRWTLALNQNGPDDILVLTYVMASMFQ
jgi:hypothetical protein